MKTFVGLAISNPEFSILVQTLQFIDANLPESNLVGTLDDPAQSLTVFAPTNAAFGQLAVDLGFVGDASDAAAVTTFLTENVPATTLNSVVTYHVAGGALKDTDIANAGSVQTIQGSAIGAGALPSLMDLDPDLADPTLIDTNIKAANGILHVIDRVLLPIDLPPVAPPAEPAAPTIVDIAAGNPDFSILVDTLTFIDANLEGSDLLGALSNPDAGLTVFAPTNAAFGQLAADLGFDGDPADTGAVTTFLVENVDVGTLNAVVTYHVSPGVQTAADITTAGSVETLQGASIGTGELPTLTDQEPDLIDPSLIATDIEASNGIVHVIDRVLLPVDLEGNDAPSITEIVAASGEGFDANAADFDILLEAVKTAGLADTLADANVDLTVFAPTDEAFVNLARDLGFHGTDEGDAWGFLVDALTVIGKGDPIPLLTEVLTYHVAGQSLQASQVLGADAIETLQGGTLGVEGTSIIDNDPDSFDAELIATDIQANNGVVHVINEVLIPTDLLAGKKTDLKIGDDGRDFFSTGRGDDFVSSKGGNDFVFLGSGDDVALAGDGNDFVFGGRGADHIDGGAGRDKIYGGSGNDTITGGTGNDTMFGGRGADTFVFNEGDGRDKIWDFNSKGDQIDLSGTDIESFDQLNISGGFFGAHIDLGNGDSIDLAGVRSSTLSEEDFIF